MFKIVKDPAPSLRAPSKEVPLPLSKENSDLIAEMMVFLQESQDEEFRKKHPKIREGVGLAAPQIGRNIRMLVIYYKGQEEGQYVQYELVNPKIIVNSVKKCYIDSGEGCLSVDEEHPGHVFRDFKVIVDAYDALQGKKIKITARGFDAIVLQHEIDHLDGVLFYDHIDPKDPMKVLPDALSV